MFEVKEVNVVAVNRRFLFSVVVQLILILKPMRLSKVSPVSFFDIPAEGLVFFSC